jgi:hypothetical protein
MKNNYLKNVTDVRISCSSLKQNKLLSSIEQV